MATPDGIVPSSGTSYIDGLLWGVKWNTDAANPVSYYLRNDFLSWNATETTAFQGVLQAYANVANVNFVTQNDTGADLWVYKLSDAAMTANFGAGVLGVFGPPDTATFPSFWGVGALNAEGAGWHTAGLQPGGFSYSVTIHEVGHALGLAHPHDNGGTSSTYPNLGIGNLDDGLNTVMSYNDIGQPWNPYSSYSTSTNWGTYGQIATPMAFDIAAVQHIYGANTSYNTGNDTYSLLTDRYEAIWDAGGTDTISAAGLTGSVTIDLNEGTYLSSQSGSYGGYTIAYGANIENAIGGSGNDTLTGNALANLLDGGAGNDTMSGGAGDDTYVVDSAGDQVTEVSAGGTDLVKSSVSYTLGANVENLTLTGTADVSGTGNALANVITGNTGANVLEGGGGNDTLDGGAGNDTASYAGASGAVSVSLAGGGATGADGSDTLANIQNLTGSAYGDTLTGDGGANVLSGGAGDDVLAGGAGADSLAGGAGTDAADYGASSAGVTVSLAAGTASGGDAQGDSYTSIEGITGSAHADTLTGDAAANTLAGGADDDALAGGGGDDILVGGTGADTLDGGDGVDSADYSGSTAGVTVSLAAATGSGGDAAGDGLSGIENVVGSAYADKLTGDAAANTLAGGDGDDTLVGGGGADTLDGGTGTDDAEYKGSTSGVTVSLAAGIASGGDAQGDILTDIENLTGSDFADQLTGDSGANVLTGGLGADTLSGGAGDDVYVYAYGDGSDTISDSGGSDQIQYSGSAPGEDDWAGITRDGADMVVTLDDGSVLRLADQFAGAAIEQINVEGDGLYTLQTGLVASAAKDVLVGTAAGGAIVKSCVWADHAAARSWRSPSTNLTPRMISARWFDPSSFLHFL